MNNGHFKSVRRAFYKDWTLYFSAILTWSLITYVSLAPLPFQGEFLIRASGFVLFIVLFLFNIFYLDKLDVVSRRKVKVSLIVQVITVWLLIYFDRYDVAPILLVLIATQLASLFNKKQTFMILLVMNVGYYFLISHSSDRGFFGILIYFLLQLFAYSAIDIMNRAERDKEKIAEINRELMATRFMLKETSQRKERLRISRDLHDVIGHQLTALSLNLEVSCHKVPDEYKAMLKENLQQAKTLLSDVRQVVKEMRHEEEFDLVTSLNNLVAQLPDCQLTVINPPQIKSLSLKQQLMFCLQEGISNALRHGKANQLILNADEQGGVIKITLVDNGAGNKKSLNEGSGLLGMKERLVGFNGNVDLVNGSSGCELIITVEDCYD